jgi:hypothetical protein
MVFVDLVRALQHRKPKTERGAHGGDSLRFRSPNLAALPPPFVGGAAD